jgi:hypothetical protein
MVKRLFKEATEGEPIWNCKLKTFTRNFTRRRKTISETLANPNLLKISLKTFRHWKATNEYYRTKDTLESNGLLYRISLPPHFSHK